VFYESSSPETQPGSIARKIYKVVNDRDLLPEWLSALQPYVS
jgi:hypothetical protein